MTKQSEIESLLSAIITLFTDEFGSGAILRGGMVLQLLDSPRLTNHLDYLFVLFQSKNEITKIELDNFFAFLRYQVESLSNDEVDQELGALLPKEELLGLELKMKKAIMCKF